VHVDEAGAIRGGDAELVGEDLDGALEERGIGAGEIDEVGGVDRDRGDVELIDPPAEVGHLWGVPLLSAPRRRVVTEDLHRRGADLACAVGGLHEPGPDGQVGTETPAVGEHHRMIAQSARCGRLGRRWTGTRSSRSRR
jgi:hypothetical protein